MLKSLYPFFVLGLIGCASNINKEPSTPDEILIAYQEAKSKNDDVKQLKYINELIKLYPTENSHFLERGIIYLNGKNNFAAINDFSKSIELNPKYYKSYYFRGMAKFNVGQIEDALSDFNKTIEMNEDYYDAYWFLSVLSLVDLKIDSSLEYMLRYNKYKPNRSLKYLESLERLKSEQTAFSNNPDDFYTTKDLCANYNAFSIYIGNTYPQYLPSFKNNVRPIIMQLFELSKDVEIKRNKAQYIFDSFEYDYLANPIDDIRFDLPFIYREAGIRGTIKIRFFVDINGNVTEWEVKKGIDSKLDSIAVEKIKSAKFKPAMLDGKLVESWRELEFKF